MNDKQAERLVREAVGIRFDVDATVMSASELATFFRYLTPYAFQSFPRNGVLMTAVKQYRETLS